MYWRHSLKRMSALDPNPLRSHYARIVAQLFQRSAKYREV